jgi:structure-specific recognition protein 1
MKFDKTGTFHKIFKQDIEAAKWLHVARGYELRFVLKTSNLDRFDGFGSEDRVKIAEYLKTHFSIPLEDVSVALKGRNKGTAAFANQMLAFNIGSQLAFEIPLAAVVNASAQRHDVTLELAGVRAAFGVGRRKEGEEEERNEKEERKKEGKKK